MKYLKKTAILFYSFFCSFSVNGQNATKIILPALYSSHTDTIRVVSEKYTALHYHLISEDTYINKFHFKGNDEIFTDSFNNFSRLILKDRYGTSFFNVPTVPLTNIFILENKKLILGLSRYSASPYYIVLYDMHGNLLYKRHFYYELKMSKSEIKAMVFKYPSLKHCFEQRAGVFKDGDNYYIEITVCIDQIIGKDSEIKSKKIIPSRYFPNASLPSEPFCIDGKYAYKEYLNFFSYGNPLDDLIMIGSTPYLLVLNDDNGQKVNIPLISNCDILKEIED